MERIRTVSLTGERSRSRGRRYEHDGAHRRSSSADGATVVELTAASIRREVPRDMRDTSGAAWRDAGRNNNKFPVGRV